MISDDPDDVVAALVEQYSAIEPVASLLCDRHDPDGHAFRFVGPVLEISNLTFGQLGQASSQLAAALHSCGLRRGDRIATLMDKSPDYVVALLAIWRIGAVHVPLFTAFAFAAIDLRLSGADAKAVIFDTKYRSKLRHEEGVTLAGRDIILIAAGGECEANEVSYNDLLKRENIPPVQPVAIGPDDPLIHIFTSGTTGKAKGVVVPKRALACFHAYGLFALDLREDDVYWNAADPGWAYGLYFAIILPMLLGQPSILLTCGFSADLTYEVARRLKVTNFAAAPTVYRAMMASELAQTRLELRCASSAGEPLTPDVIHWSATALGASVHDHYGQTETAMVINNHYHPALKADLKSGCMGRVMPGWTAEILDDASDTSQPSGRPGRLALDLSRSPFAWFSGYNGATLLESGKVSKDGRWYFTGDVAMRDPDGDFFFSARDDDVIIMAGYRIGPFDIESVLATHAAVRESAVIAVPDRIRGEVVEAYVVLNDAGDAGEALAAELQNWVKSRYAAHAYPRAIHFVKALPKTPSGKVQRFHLRRQRAEELGIS